MRRKGEVKNRSMYKVERRKKGSGDRDLTNFKGLFELHRNLSEGNHKERSIRTLYRFSL